MLLVTIDTLRADRLAPALMPSLAALAGRGAAFVEARTVVPLTLPAHVSIMTGVRPAAHGVRENGVGRFAGTPAPLARRLKDAGYDTAAFVGAFVLDRRFGLDAGFDTYDDEVPRDTAATDRLEAQRPADAVADCALAWLAAHPVGSRPYFLWVHFYDPHAPYTPPPAALARAGGDAYDGEVVFADSQLGRLLATVDGRGERDRTLVVVAGDHGESLGEHGERTHGMLLYDAALRVPLVFAGRGIAPGRRTTPVTIVDVAPTILARLGIDAGGMEGADALSASLAPDRESYAETDYPQTAGWSRLRALAEGRWKVIVSSETELYDVEADPGETHDVAAAHAATARAMAARLGELEQAEPARPASAPSADAMDRLRALGYAGAVRPALPPGAGDNPARRIDAWVKFEDALGLVARGRPGDAEPALRALARAFPDAPVFQSTWARALAESGQPRRGLAVYRELVRRRPADAVLLHDLAVCAREAGEAAEARRAEEASLALVAGQAAPWNGLGLLAADAGDDAGAARAFESAVRLDPTNVSYRVNLGNARRAAGDLDGAEHAYREALDRDPNAIDALNGLGVLLVQRKRAAEAVTWFERALAVDASYVEARLNLGIAFQESGQPARAAEQYREVLKAPARYAKERQAAAALLKSLK